MAESRTIFCKDRKFREIVEVVRLLDPDCSIEGTEAAWTRLRARGTEGEIRLTVLVDNGEEGDRNEFLRVLVRTAKTARSTTSMLAVVESEREAIVAFLYDAELLVGVVAEPGFDADPRYEAIVSEIAFRCNGLIFDGLHLLNAMGDVLMRMYV